jgi:hypothetical protein
MTDVESISLVEFFSTFKGTLRPVFALLFILIPTDHVNVISRINESNETLCKQFKLLMRLFRFQITA